MQADFVLKTKKCNCAVVDRLITEFRYPFFENRQNWRNVLRVTTPLPDAIGVDPSGELNIAGRLGVDRQSFREALDGRIPFQPKENQSFPDLRREIPHHRLVPNLSHCQWEPGAICAVKGHDRVVIGRRIIEVQKLKHRRIDLESVAESS